MDEIHDSTVHIEEGEMRGGGRGGGGGGGVEDEDFYENIEAPKFVDLRAPDRHRPENDDRYWFCLRVGCDQKHEEEMDSETIYKNFVLRVMAARSPNVRLRKALFREDNNSKNMKCPLTVPAKSSKSRISRLAMISSINRKIVDGKTKFNPLAKPSATPIAKAKQSSFQAKALTTPRHNKRLSNADAFRSFRNPKPTTIAVPKNKLVAKALVFHSPRKTVKIKTSVELRSSVKMLCSGMKKLDIARGKNQLAVEASRKQLRGREVKSRVYDSLHSQNHKRREAKSSKCVTKNKKNTDSEQCLGPMPHQDAENDPSDMEIDAKSRNGSLEACSSAITLKSGEDNNTQEECLISDQNNVEALSESSRSVMTSLSSSEQRNSSKDGNDINEANDQIKPSPEKEKIPEVIENDDKENALITDVKKTNEGEILEGDDKENCSASDENRQPNLDHKLAEKNKILRKQENSKSIPKVTGVMGKAAKESSNGAAAGPPGMKYRKPKPTTPKPFRFRTDERGILKEATVEKKNHHLPPLGEIDHQPDIGTPGVKISKRQAQTKSSAKRDSISARENINSVASKLEYNQDKAIKNSDSGLNKTKPLLMKQIARPRGKSMVSLMKPGQLGVIEENSTKISRPKEAAKPNDCGASPATKASPSTTPRSLARGRRAATIPKEPNFHSIHTPKSCTRKLA